MLASELEMFFDELDSICDRINKFDDITSSSPLICEFTEKLIGSPLIQPSIDELEKDKMIDCAPMDDVLNKLSQKIWPACEDGIDYIKSNQINDPIITCELIWFKSRELNANNLYIQYYALARFLKQLRRDQSADHRNFIERYAIVDEGNEIKPVKLYFNLDALTKELKYLGRIKKTKAWHSLQQLKSFYAIYNTKMYEEHKNLFGNEYPINQLQMDVCYSALDSALSTSAKPTFYEKGFNPNDYKDHMQRMYHYIRQRITVAKPVSISSSSLVETNIPTLKIYAYDYKQITAELKIDGCNPIKYQIRSNPAKLLKKITMSKSKRLSYLDIYNTFLREPGDPAIKELGQKEIKQIDSLIRSINERLPDSMPKFLIDQKHTYKLNDKFVLISSSYKSNKS